jgi:peptidoglycan/xylan/chitin deacetylase (PgdA/CDA1 family)
MISVCFRFDDPSATSDHELEHRVVEMFARHDVPLCVAAIPFAWAPGGESIPLSAQNAAHLVAAARAGTVEIAQHGHSHIRRGSDAHGLRSEFAGVPAAEQVRLIREGMQHLASLFSCHIKGFVPPWNTYDPSTVQAVGEAGFQYLSAGDEVLASRTVVIVPRTCTLRTVRSVLAKVFCFRLLAPVVVVVFHPDDFEEFKFPPRPDEPPPYTNLRELDALLGWIKSTPNLRAETIGRIAESTRNGTRLRNPADLRLPYRVKASLPPMLARSGAWRTYTGTLWGALRSADRLGPSM